MGSPALFYAYTLFMLVSQHVVSTAFLSIRPYLHFLLLVQFWLNNIATWNYYTFRTHVQPSVSQKTTITAPQECKIKANKGDSQQQSPQPAHDNQPPTWMCGVGAELVVMSGLWTSLLWISLVGFDSAFLRISCCCFSANRRLDVSSECVVIFMLRYCWAKIAQVRRRKCR